MNDSQLKNLLKKFKDGNCTDEEKALLEAWAHQLNQEGDPGLTEQDLQEAQTQMWEAVRPVSPARPFTWLYAAACLCVFAIAGILAVQYLNNQPVAVKQNAKLVKQVIKPGGNNAVLTLAGGKQIILNHLANGQVVQQAGITIKKQADGQLLYFFSNQASAGANATACNLLQTPKGGQYQINLPDGTRVWLNAASSLRFPVTFSGPRVVELSGEGYFEVKARYDRRGHKLPFLVKTLSPAGDGQTVEVLGTHFNINAYRNLGNIKTTLLEGSVKVVSVHPATAAAQQDSKILKPGQQSLVRGTGNVQVGPADVEADVAWKEGYFRFNNESLESIMYTLSNWYDVEVIYEQEAVKKETFSGVITRFANVTDLLKMLQLTGDVRFDVKGKQITVSRR
jgi:transmembrane sensor